MDTTIKQYVKTHTPHVVFLTPCYGSQCYTQYMTRLIQTLQLCHSHGIKTTTEFCNNDSLIPRARNNLVAKAMETEGMTHIMFIDADIAWNPEDVLKLLVSNLFVVGGIYPKKRLRFDYIKGPETLESWQTKKTHPFCQSSIPTDTLIQNCLLDYNINPLTNEGKLNVQENRIEVDTLATGFMMVRREVIECMQKAFPSTEHTEDVGFFNETKKVFALFDCAVEDGSYLSEDWLFCRRWRNMGGKVHADITIHLTHIGVHLFEGSYLHSIL